MVIFRLAALVAALLSPASAAQLPVAARPWRSRTALSAERAAAVLVRVAPRLDAAAAESVGLDWGLLFYDAATGRPAVVASLAETARGLEDESDGLYLIPMPPGAYVASSLYTTIGGLPHIQAVPGARFESFTLVPGEIYTLGTVETSLTMKPGQEAVPLTSWTQADQTVGSRFEPRMPAAFAKRALAKILSRPDTIAGWEPALRDLAFPLPPAGLELARASRR